MRTIRFGVWGCCLAFASTTFAAEGASDRDFSEGVALVKAGKYQAAEQPLRKVLERSPDDPQAAFYLGTALNRRSGGKESESLLKQALRDLPEEPTVNFELGVHYFNKEIYAEAQDYFENTISVAPRTEYAVQAKEYLEKIKAQGKEKPWQLTAYTGFQYDSNVLLSNDPRPKGYSDRSDWSALFNARGTYTPLKSEKGDVTFAASVFRSVHAKGELRHFDITQGLLEAAGNYNMTARLVARLSYDFEYLLLGDDAYDTAHTVTPSLKYTTERWGTTTLEYGYRHNRYHGFADNADRTGFNQTVTLSHLYPISDKLAIWGGYNHEEEETRKESWDFSGNGGIVGLRFSLPWQVSGEMTAKGIHREYGGPDPAGNGRTRTENEFSGSVSFSRSLGEHWFLSFEESFTRNIANVTLYQYSRSVTSLILNARF